jgi:hypothetical protein
MTSTGAHTNAIVCHPLGSLVADLFAGLVAAQAQAREDIQGKAGTKADQTSRRRQRFEVHDGRTLLQGHLKDCQLRPSGVKPCENLEVWRIPAAYKSSRLRPQLFPVSLSTSISN